jgi:hypothetical protein
MTDAKTEHGHRMGIAVGCGKIPTAGDRAPRAVCNCHWLTQSSKHRTNRALVKTGARKIKILNGTIEPVAHCAVKKLVLSKQNVIPGFYVKIEYSSYA